MSIFPTKILLATDGSSEAQLAARTAVDLDQKTPFVLSSWNNVTCGSEDKARQINEISQEPEYKQKC